MAKPNTKVKKDKHGLYVKTGGYVFRPVETVYANYVGHTPYGKYLEEGTKHAEGDAVVARHKSCTPFAYVKTPDGENEEWWQAHGEYGKHGEGHHENCWTPKIN